MILVALCAALGVWLLMPAVPDVARLTATVAQPRRHGGRRGWVLAAVGLAAGLVLAPAGAPRTLVAVAEVVGIVGTVFVRSRRAHARADRIRRDVARACWELAGEVSAGRIPAEALAVVADDVPVLRRSASIAALGGDVVACWRSQATDPGAEGLLTLARAWEVSAATGAPMAEALRAVAETLRARDKAAQTVGGELAAPRATGRLLAALPLLGVGLGFLLGGDPVEFLLHEVVGQLCLVAGVALAGAGLLWSEHLADRAVTS